MYQQSLGQAKSAIANLSSQELKELLEDDEKLEGRINNVLEVLNQEKHVLIANNRCIAEENVNREPEIIERKSRISEMSEKGKIMCSKIQDNLNELKLKNGDKTPDTALALLQAAAAECEEKSEEIATKFQDKEITIDEYLEHFMTLRKLMHSRKLKIDKMTELLRHQSPTSAGRGFSNPGYPTPFYPPYAANLHKF